MFEIWNKLKCNEQMKIIHFNGVFSSLQQNTQKRTKMKRGLSTVTENTGIRAHMERQIE